MPKLKTESAEPKTAGDLRNHNTRTMLYSFIQRLERLDEERRGLGADMKEVREEAKGLGFDIKIIGVVLRRRKMDKADLMETDSVLELYEDTIREAEKAELKESEDQAGD